MAEKLTIPGNEVYRPRGGFTQVPNVAARDSSMSFRARGILLFALSHTEDWKMPREALAREGTEGLAAVQTALNELTEHGYRKVIRQQREDGTWTTKVRWFEDPADDPDRSREN